MEFKVFSKYITINISNGIKPWDIEKSVKLTKSYKTQNSLKI
jgi:hypothetical protein